MTDRQHASNIMRAQAEPIMRIMQTMEPFTLNGVMWTAQHLIQLLNIDPANIDIEIASLAGWVAYWGTQSASAKKNYDLEEVRYRIARDTWGSSRRAQGKITIAQTEEEWRTQPNYFSLYEKKIELERLWNTTQFIYEAFKAKSYSLSTLASWYADERRSHNVGRTQ